MSSPIRVGIVGLSFTGGWAATAHLPYLQLTAKYRVVAVCNSSIESSQEALRSYGFQHAQAYDSVPAMCGVSGAGAVDLVVCAVSVFSHYSIIRPAIEAGKDVFVEWPLCASTAEAEEILLLAKKKGVKTMIGLQGSVSHVQMALQDVIQSGRIGKPLATQVLGSACTGETGTRIVKRYEYFKDRSLPGAVGQVMLSIYVGHTFHPIAKLLGEPKYVSAQLRTTWPRVDILDGDQVTRKDVEKTADDYASLQGTTGTGVAFTFCLRGGDAFEANEGLVWDIIGDKGQIRLTGSTMMLNLGADDFTIKVKNYATGEIDTIQLAEPLNLPLPAQNVGIMYENFANGGYVPDFEEAVQRHKFLDAMFASAELKGTQQQVEILRASG